MQMALVSEMLKPTAEPWSRLGYLHQPGTEDEVKGISHWVVTDLDTEVCSIHMCLIIWQYAHSTSSLCKHRVSRKPGLRRRTVLCCDAAACGSGEPAAGTRAELTLIYMSAYLLKSHLPVPTVQNRACSRASLVSSCADMAFIIPIFYRKGALWLWQLWGICKRMPLRPAV